MELSELILILEQLAALARGSGDVDVEKFWTSVIAAVSSNGQPKQAMEKEAAWVFYLAPDRYREYLRKVLGPMPESDRSNWFSIISLAVNECQKRGAISQQKADALRAAAVEVENELKTQLPGSGEVR